MRSFFEISGEIIECVLDTSQPSPQIDAFVAARPERGRMAQEASGPRSGRGKAEEPESQPGFMEHVYKTGSHPIREFRELPGPIRFGLLRNPIAFASWGVLKQLEVIEMHYDYAKS